MTLSIDKKQQNKENFWWLIIRLNQRRLFECILRNSIDSRTLTPPFSSISISQDPLSLLKLYLLESHFLHLKEVTQPDACRKNQHLDKQLKQGNNMMWTERHATIHSPLPLVEPGLSNEKKQGLVLANISTQVRESG